MPTGRAARALVAASLVVVAGALALGDNEPTVAVRTTEIAATADSHVVAEDPESTHGSARELRVDGEPAVRSYIRFDTEVAAAQVRSATLRIWAASSHSRGVDIHDATNSSWSEEALTFSNAPQQGRRIGSTGRTTEGTWVDVDVSSAIGTSRSITLALISDHPTAAAFASREDPVHWPRLIVRAASSAIPLEAEVTTSSAPATTSGPAPASSPATSPESTSAPLAGPTTGSVRVAAFGDAACEGTAVKATPPDDACRQNDVGSLVERGRYSALLVLGDLQYEEGSLEQFNTSYDPAFGRFKAITYPVAGNHEYITPDADGYFQYFGERAGDPDKGYYSFDLGSWHIVALNSNCAEVNGCDPSSDQLRWLRADLESTQSSCIAAMTHHPRWVQGKYDDFEHLDDMYRVMVEYGVDIMLSGHDHSYQRFAPLDADRAVSAQGIRQFVVGTGGKNHASTITEGGPLESHDASTFGLLELGLNDSSYSWAFIPVDPGGFTDSGEADCN